MPEPTAPKSAFLCAPWCEAHDDAGPLDQWCLTAPRFVEPVAESSARIELGIDRYAGRGETGWCESAARVCIEPLASWAAMQPHEARRLARLLLAAADIADGVSVEW